MSRSTEITFTRFCENHEHGNYHMAHREDTNRAYLCGCSLSIRINGLWIWCGNQKGKLKYNLKRDKWVCYKHNQWKFNHK